MPNIIEKIEKITLPVIGLTGIVPFPSLPFAVEIEEQRALLGPEWEKRGKEPLPAYQEKGKKKKLNDTSFLHSRSTQGKIWVVTEQVLSFNSILLFIAWDLIFFPFLF